MSTQTINGRGSEQQCVRTMQRRCVCTTLSNSNCNKSASAFFLFNVLPACRSERMEEQMNDRSMGERENKREYTNNQCKRERTTLRPNQATSSNATKVCMENPVKLECKQERKRFLPVERAAGMSQRANGRAHERAINGRRRPNQRPNQATSSNAKKAIERLNT